jgi:hypothetical protein
MKLFAQALLMVVAVLPSVASAQMTRCDAKRQSIEHEIAYAQAHGHAQRVEGLETALAGLNANCTDAGLRSDAEKKVAQAQAKLDEREKDLREAKSEGKSAKKIASQQRKVDEAHADLERLRAEASK